jgi:pimeloyl-ACP methyl ester carboxylesterase
MPSASVNGVELHYCDVGSGFTVVFCHEYASDMRALEQQIRFFSRRYRCIAFNYRGYPPSSVPRERSAYSNDELVADLGGLIDHLGIEQAYLVGVATGGTVALNFAIARPRAVRALVVVGAGAGSSDRDNWLAGARALSEAIERDGVDALVANMEKAPQRQALRRKDPAAWDEFIAQIGDLSPLGLVHMMANALMTRKPLFELEGQLRELSIPVLVAVGDQDTPAFEACVYVSRTVPHGALAVLPACGHMIPLEEPALFNAVTSEFFAQIDNGRWGRWRAAPRLAPAVSTGASGGRGRR